MITLLRHSRVSRCLGRRAGFALGLWLGSVSASAQGLLTPPSGAPAPSQKSLDEVWQKLAALEAQGSALGAQVNQAVLQQRLAVATLVPGHLGTWEHSTVPWNQLTGIEPSLAIAPDGQPVVADFTSGAPCVSVARTDGAAWTISSLPPNSYAASLAFSPAGVPVIAYFDRPTASQRVARWAEGAWAITVVDAQTEILRGSSLALGPGGQPTIAYAAVSGELRIAQFDGASWQVQVMHDAAPPVQALSLAFDPAGRPAVAYEAYGAEAVRFARSGVAGWAVLTVAAPAYKPTLAYGPDGHPAVLFSTSRTGSGQALKLARFDGVTWTTTTIAAGPVDGEGRCLRFGPDGRPTVVYRVSSSPRRLMIAQFDGAAWIATELATGQIGHRLELAFGPDGQPNILYSRSDTSPHLHFARRVPWRP